MQLLALGPLLLFYLIHLFSHVGYLFYQIGVFGDDYLIL